MCMLAVGPCALRDMFQHDNLEMLLFAEYRIEKAIPQGENSFNFTPIILVTDDSFAFGIVVFLCVKLRHTWLVDNQKARDIIG